MKLIYWFIELKFSEREFFPFREKLHRKREVIAIMDDFIFASGTNILKYAISVLIKSRDGNGLSLSLATL